MISKYIFSWPFKTSQIKRRHAQIKCSFPRMNRFTQFVRKSSCWLRDVSPSGGTSSSCRSTPPSSPSASATSQRRPVLKGIWCFVSAYYSLVSKRLHKSIKCSREQLKWQDCKKQTMGICVLCGFNFFVSILNLRSWQQYPLPSIAWRSKTGE